MASYPHLATRLFNTPLLITPDKAEIIVGALAERLGVSAITRATQPTAMASHPMLENPAADPNRPCEIVAGVALIPVCGTLVQKSDYVQPYSGMTGYNAIRLNVLTALEDKKVDAIVLDIDSPGGEVAGCFDLADTIFRARGRKPIHAILNECACSAAYAIASAADRVTIPRTGVAGSIGVVWLHADLSKALAGAGVEVTLLHYGARKTDGNEYQPLPPGVAARIQTDIDTLGELFVATVARNRGMKPAAVRAQQAGTYLGAAAVAAGLADAVSAPDRALADLVSSL